MARIAPDRFPDRFAFERHARALRRQEFDRLLAAASGWIRARFAEFEHTISPNHARAARSHARH